MHEQLPQSGHVRLREFALDVEASRVKMYDEIGVGPGGPVQDHHHDDGQEAIEEPGGKFPGIHLFHTTVRFGYADRVTFCFATGAAWPLAPAKTFWVTQYRKS